MTRDSQALSDLAEAVADGAAVDWSAAESTASPHHLPVVRALREVEQVLGAHWQAALADDADKARSRPARLREGESWNHLEIRGYLGGGGFGDVYDAFDPDIERPAALKVLLARKDSDQSLLQEARLLAKVNHENVVRVYSAELVDGRVGIAMERLHGHTLTAELAQFGALGADEASVIGIKLCDALAEVHRKGIVHRDVKAQNVMREPGGRIVLMDFGIGFEQASGAVTEAAGTPAYLAPELLASGEASVASDLYALGVLLFHLVTGEFPVRGDSLAEFRSRHEAGDVRHLPDLRSDLPEAFVRVVEKALAKDPAQRYRTAGAFHRALSRAMASTVLGDAEASRARFLRRMRRSLPFAPVWVAASFLVFAAIAWRLWPFVSPEKLVVWKAPIVDRSGEAAFGASVDAALRSALRSSQAFASVSGDDMLLISRQMLRPHPEGPWTDEELPEAAERAGAGAVLGGDLVAGDAWRLRLWLFDPAESGLRRTAEQPVGSPTTAALDNALDLALAELESASRQWRGSNPSRLERATTSSMQALRLYTAGVRAYGDGDIEAAEVNLRRSLEVDPEFALAHLHLGHSLAAQGSPESALTTVRQAYDLRSRTSSDLERLTIEGAYFAVVRQYLEAIETYRQVLGIEGEDPATLRQIAIAYRELGDLDQAIQYARRGRYDNTSKSINHGFLVYTLAAAGRPEEALREAQGTRERFALTPYLLLSESLAFLGLDQLEEALGRTRQMAADESPVYQNLASWMEARIRIYAGELDQASEILYQDRRTDAVEGTDHLEMRRRYWAARCRWLRGETREALATLRSLDLAAIPSHMTGWRSVAAMRAELGDVEGARTILEQLEAIRREYPSLLADLVTAQVRGEILLAEGDPAGAVEAFGTVEAQSDVSCLRSLVRAYVALGDLEQAATYDARLIERRGELLEGEFPGLWVEAQVRRARSLERLGRESEAAANWRQARAFWGRQADAVFGPGGSADALAGAPPTPWQARRRRPIRDPRG